MKQPHSPYESQTELGKAFTARLNQLGMSRRQLVEATGLSRQTLHNVEHSNLPVLPATCAAIDKALRWKEGTAFALHKGEPIEQEDEETKSARLDAMRLRIVSKVILMTEDELEKILTEWAHYEQAS